MIPVSEFNQWRKCGAPGCGRRVKQFYFCCAQHRSLLGLDLSSDLQTRWRERRLNPEEFARVKAKALRAWGWQPETLCVGKPQHKS